MWGEACLDGEVLVDQQVGAFEVSVHDGGDAAVQVIHAAGNVHGHTHAPLLIQDHVGRPEPHGVILQAVTSDDIFNKCRKAWETSKHISKWLMPCDMLGP